MCIKVLIQMDCPVHYCALAHVHARLALESTTDGETLSVKSGRIREARRAVAGVALSLVMTVATIMEGAVRRFQDSTGRASVPERRESNFCA